MRRSTGRRWGRRRWWGRRGTACWSGFGPGRRWRCMGCRAGFIGAGAKTVIPAKAVAKVSMRLVPEMTPAETFAQLKSFVESIAPKGCAVEVRLIHSGDAILVSTDNPYVGAATAAMKAVFGRETVFVRGGRIDSDCGGFCAGAWDSYAADGVWAAGRQPSCAE